MKKLGAKIENDKKNKKVFFPEFFNKNSKIS